MALWGCTAISGLVPGQAGSVAGAGASVRVQGYLALPAALIGHNTGNLIGSNTGNLVGHNTGNYRVAYDEGQRIPNAPLTAFNWRSDQRPALATTTTDSAGRYVLTGLPANILCLLQATGSLAVTPMAVRRLSSDVTQPQGLSDHTVAVDGVHLELKAPLAVNLSTTLVAAKLRADAVVRPTLLSSITNPQLLGLENAVTAALTDDLVVALQNGADPVSVFDRLSLDAAVAQNASSAGLIVHPVSATPTPSPTPGPTATPSAAPVLITPTIE
jgi:hypothetical protein